MKDGLNTSSANIVSTECASIILNMATAESSAEKITSTNDERELPDEFKSLPLILAHLKRLLKDNTEYFQRYIEKDVYKRLCNGFNSMLENTDPLKELALALALKASHFDYSPEVKGNGYRSLLRLLEHCIRSVTELSAYCCTHRDKFYFRSHHYCLEVEAYTNLFERTRELLQYAKILLDDPEDRLMPENFDPKIMLEVEELDRECFYGRTLGFQFTTSLRYFLQVVCVAMASFAEGYHRHGSSSLVSVTTSFLNSGKYSVNPEMRAKMIVKVTQKTNMEFCKAFWSLTENYGLQHVPFLVSPAMKVNYVFNIPADPFEMLSTSGEKVSITPPCSWSGLAPVQARLISAEWREGQNIDGMDSQSNHRRQPKPKSRGFILHVHGGGFVAQSSKSHEVYLRIWARELKVPIVSVDYSLAPEAPFPRALEECFFAYAWVLNNADKLGTTAEYVCLAGDSAGGNISVSLSLRAAQYGIRTPDSVLTAYSPFNVQYVPSPSRLLSLMDPLLPTGILAGCLASYSGLDRSPFDECTTKAIKSLTGKSSKPVDVSLQSRKKTSSFLSKFRWNRESKQSGGLGSPLSNGYPAMSPTAGSSAQVGNPTAEDKGTTSPVVGSQDSILGSESFHSCRSPDSFSVSFHKDQDDVPFSQTKAGSCANSDSVPQEITGSVSHIEDLKSDEINFEPLDSTPSGPEVTGRPGHDCLSELETSDRAGHDNHKSFLENGKVEIRMNSTESNHVPQRPKDLKLSNSHTANMKVKPINSPCQEPLMFQLDDHLPLDAGTPLLGGDEQAEAKSRVRVTSMSQVCLPITKNPFMSPLLASDEMLATLPPIDIVACSLDPILDDSVEFARRLRDLGKDVELYILQDLPHGFLNFNLVSQEAKEGCDFCITLLKRSLTGKRRSDRIERALVF